MLSARHATRSVVLLLLLIGALCAGPARARPRMSVHCRSGAGKWERKAASDLAYYLGRLTGEKVPVSHRRPSASGAGLRFVVGKMALAMRPVLRQRLARVMKPHPVLRSDAITVDKQGSIVYLAGSNDDSDYFAVSWFLQRQGCRWYMPTSFGECIPRLSGPLDTSGLPYTYAPPFEVRTYWISWMGDTDGYEAFAHRNFYNLQRDPPPSQDLDRLLPPGGGLSLLSNSTVDAVVRKVEKKQAASQPISLCISDHLQMLAGEHAKALAGNLYDKFFDGPAVADLFLPFYNKVCRNLWRLHPHSTSKISFLAYANLTLPPQRRIRAASPLIAYVAPIDVDPNHALDDPRSPRCQDLYGALRRWVKVMQGRVIIYDYDQGMLVWRDLPDPSVAVFSRDVKLYRRLGILGVSTESRNALATTFTNLFFRGQLMWNPDLDVKAELSRFYRNFYGPAGPPMQRYWSTIYRAWREQTITSHEFFVIPAIYTPAVVRSLRKAMKRAERLKTRLAPPYRARLRFTRLGFEVLESYLAMVHAAAGECQYDTAVSYGERGLKARDALTAMSGLFTTYKRMGEKGPAWWPGEVALYRQLAGLTDGHEGRLIAATPLTWDYRSDPHDVGIWRGWARQQHGQGWRPLRVDLIPRGQGLYDRHYYSPQGFGWYRCSLSLERAQAAPGAVLVFPGLFNDAWLYLNGNLVAVRRQNKLWWNNNYTFCWKVPLGSALRPGRNRITLRTVMGQHPSGIFRRPFLYRPARR